MPHIEISDYDLTRLKRIAEPLVDTSATAFGRVMDFFEAHHGRAIQRSATVSENTARAFSPEKLPPLVHTKLLMGGFANRAPDKHTWDSLARLALTVTFDKHSDVESLRRVSGANVVAGKKADEGYKAVRDYPFSYQGMSATDAATCVIRCARVLKREAVFEFEWRLKEEAYAPGVRGRVEIAPL